PDVCKYFPAGSLIASWHESGFKKVDYGMANYCHILTEFNAMRVIRELIKDDPAIQAFIQSAPFLQTAEQIAGIKDPIERMKALSDFSRTWQQYVEQKLSKE